MPGYAFSHGQRQRQDSAPQAQLPDLTVDNPSQVLYARLVTSKAEIRKRVEAVPQRSLNPDEEDEDPVVRRLAPGTPIMRLMGRLFYGGRKGRSARKRLRGGLLCTLIFLDGTQLRAVIRMAPGTSSSIRMAPVESD